MQRLAECFAERRRQGGKVLVGFLSAGDPDLAQSEQDIRTALDAGVDILELGVPFSDPTADGPAIQEAGQRALAAGVSVTDIIAMAGRLRADYPKQPMILFGYANPFFSKGYEATAREARAAGLDGMLVVDLPHEEAGEFEPVLRNAGLAMIPLIAPTTPLDRASRILRDAQGFVYIISVTGVTGMRADLPDSFRDRIGALRRLTDLPMVIGFGVTNGEQARRVAADADGIVVGSALVRAAREQRLADMVRELRESLD